MSDDAHCGGACGGGPGACVFCKGVLTRHIGCELAQRHAQGEADLVSCPSPVARANCATLAALLRERSTFVLRLPRLAQPLTHAKALQLQCGGVRALQQALDAAEPDVHRLIGLAHERWGSLLDAPWALLVPEIAAWQARRRSAEPEPP